MSDKTPRERFVEAMRGVLAHVESVWQEHPEFIKIADGAADAFADQECEADDACWISEPFEMPTEDHEGHRAALRAEIRGEK